jgi:hypothetical protein
MSGTVNVCAEVFVSDNEVAKQPTILTMKSKVCTESHAYRQETLQSPDDGETDALSKIPYVLQMFMPSKH